MPQVKYVAVFGYYEFSDGTVAAVTRAKDKRVGDYEDILFGLPGGKVETGENLIEALERECIEEGWDISLCDIGDIFYTECFDEYICIWYRLGGIEPRLVKANKELERGIIATRIHHTHLHGLGNDNAVKVLKGS